MKYILISLIVLALGCSKEKSCENCQGNTTTAYKNATIVYGGPVSGDGCGWLVKTDDTHSYHPDVLEAAFQHDQLPVEIDYEITSEKFGCGISSLLITVIHVKDIKL